MPVRMLQQFFRLQSAGGILLVIAAVAPILINNSPFEHNYYDILHSAVIVQVGDFSINKDLHHWINDGLMAIFFLLVTLEIKREVIDGQLSSRSQISLPAIAALGGLVLPAIVIIALFYTENLAAVPLIGAALCVLLLFVLNRRKITQLSPYMLLAVILWVCILKSGLHATLAGVVVAMFIPAKGKDDSVSSGRISESVTLTETGDNTGVFRGYASFRRVLAGLNTTALHFCVELVSL